MMDALMVVVLFVILVAGVMVVSGFVDALFEKDDD